MTPQMDIRILIDRLREIAKNADVRNAQIAHMPDLVDRAMEYNDAHHQLITKIFQTANVLERL